MNSRQATHHQILSMRSHFLCFFHGKDYTDRSQSLFSAPTMIINADSLLPHLKEKVRLTHSDTSRHLLCPDCGIRTKLNTLGDGRRKCTVCGKKFRVHKVTEENKLQQCAEILLCFCLDFSAHRTAQITHHRYRLVSTFYDHFRKLLTEKNLPKEKIQLLSAHKGDIQVLHDKSRCRWCKSKIRPGKGRGGGKPPCSVCSSVAAARSTLIRSKMMKQCSTSIRLVHGKRPPAVARATRVLFAAASSIASQRMSRRRKVQSNYGHGFGNGYAATMASGNGIQASISRNLNGSTTTDSFILMCKQRKSST